MSNPVRFAGAFLDLLEERGVKRSNLQRAFEDEVFCGRLVELLTEPVENWYDSVVVAHHPSRNAVDAFLAWVFQPAEVPESALTAYYHSTAMTQLLDGLYDRDRQIVILHFALDGEPSKTPEQLSESFGIGVKRVGQILQKAPQQLARQHRELLDKARAEEAEREIQLASDKITRDAFNESTFGERAYNCLCRAHIRTFSALVARTEEDLLAITNLGQRGLDAIIETLDAKGLKLAGT